MIRLFNWLTNPAQKARDRAQAARERLQEARRRGDTRAVHYWLGILREATHAELRTTAHGWRGAR